MSEHKNGALVEFMRHGKAWRGLANGRGGFYGPDFGYADGTQVTDVRPLVALDPAEDAERLQDLYLQACGRGLSGLSMHAALLDFQKPPRIPEPGLWGVVEAINSDAGGKRTWVRRPENGAGNEWVSDNGCWRCWSELLDPVLIREGVA